MYTWYRPTARVLSTVFIPSIRVMVMGIENPAKNDASGAVHASCQAHALFTCAGRIGWGKRSIFWKAVTLG